MAGRKTMRRSESWWEMLAPPTAVRCEGHVQSGAQCLREALTGSNVCRQHGGAAPQVQARAAARIGNAADAMVKRLHEMLDDPSVEARDKIKIAQDMLDRAGLAATGKLLIGVGEIDPVEALFQRILQDPNGLMSETPVQHVPDPQIAAWNREAMEDDEPDDIVDAEVVEEPEPDDTHTVHVEGSITTPTPPHIRRDLERLGLL
jgi:hypothetical protein